jgi:hypothetical protein
MRKRVESSDAPSRSGPERLNERAENQSNDGEECRRERRLFEMRRLSRHSRRPTRPCYSLQGCTWAVVCVEMCWGVVRCVEVTCVQVKCGVLRYNETVNIRNIDV